MKKKILISTCGTGGHVIPATIFYEQLKDKFDVFFVTDKRGCRFLNLEKYKLTVINAPKLTANFFLLPRFQPIELLKPFLIILLATILSSKKNFHI